MVNVALPLCCITAACIVQQGSAEENFHICAFFAPNLFTQAVDALNVAEAVHFVIC